MYAITEQRQKAAGKEANEGGLMDVSRLTVSDLFGRFLLKGSNGGAFSGYYRSLEAMRPLLESNDWQSSVSGYYVNVAGDFDAVRLSYFTPLPDQPRQAMERFAAKRRLERAEVPEPPHEKEISQNYGGEEIRFRKYLSTCTLVGLDIMEADLLHARRLFATFRWQVMRARRPYRPHFLSTFQQQSAFYRSLRPYEQDQFWRDLEHWPNPPQVDWAHLFVNMVLGCDWNHPSTWRSFLTPQSPMPIHEINRIVSGQGFQIPDNWRP
jgi:hypothetical protein